MSAIEQCRSLALGGHALRCSACAEPQIAYNSCRNRHCPKCQGSAAQRWLEARQADLLPVAYYHVVFTLPAPISAIAYINKEIIYGLLFDIAAETLRTIAADPKHLGARIGTTLVLHTWGSALTHHPHVHGIVPASLNSSASMSIWPTPMRSLTGSCRCANANGCSTPSARSQGPKTFSPICRATLIGSRSPTLGSWPMTSVASPSAGRTIALTAGRATKP